APRPHRLRADHRQQRSRAGHAVRPTADLDHFDTDRWRADPRRLHHSESRQAARGQRGAPAPIDRSGACVTTPLLRSSSSHSPSTTGEAMKRIDFVRVAPGAAQAMLAVQKQVNESGLERSPLELVKMRASQINGCAHCLDMHSKDARAAGETEQRLYL